jgi:hypothetical protein
VLAQPSICVVCQVSLQLNWVIYGGAYPFWAAGVLWIRLKAGENAWHPANEPHRKIGEEWLIHGIVNGKYPFADQFLEVMAQREREGQAGDVREA